MKHEFSDRLRFCRRQRGLTQEQLAEAMGVSVAAVSKWELGQSVPELETLLELADFFDLSVDALLGFRLRDGGCQEAGARIDAARREKRYDEDARALLHQALALADRFDAAPNYRADALRWYEGPDTAMAYDSMGATARAAVRQVFTQQGEDPEAGAFLTAFESEN